MEPESDIEDEVETVIKRMVDMTVRERNIEIIIKDEKKMPERLTNMLKLKGINIKESGVLRVGGYGKCGAMCVSIHTTGNESCAGKIRTNVNWHIIKKWEIYKDSYEYPDQARIEGGTQNF